MIGGKLIMERVRPIFLLITLGLGAAGYFMCTSVWADLMRIKGASWFGTEVQARILDAAEYREISWTPTIAVTYWSANPKRNHPVGKNYDYADEMTGFVFGGLISLVSLLMALAWIRGLLRGPTAASERAAEDQEATPV